jgi:DNA-binding NarL/FixJ family response regulator
MSKPHILLIDDDPYFHQLVASLTDPARVDLTWRSTGHEGIETFSQNPGGFQLLVVDYQLPDMLGTEIIERVRMRDEKVPIVMLTGYATVDVAVEAMKRGAADFFTKPLPDPVAFVRFINRTLRLDLPLPLPVPATSTPASQGAAPSDKRLPMTTQEVREWREREQPELELTEREMEIIAQVFKGLANKEIAAALFLSERTIKNHLTEIYEKIGVDGRAQLFHHFLARKA